LEKELLPPDEKATFGVVTVSNLMLRVAGLFVLSMAQ
jgi:hypothetical protein